MKVVGYEVRESTSKKTGTKYQAAILYLEEPLKNGRGMRTESIYTLAERIPPDVTIGTEIRVLYNRYGSVESVEIV